MKAINYLLVILLLIVLVGCSDEKEEKSQASITSVEKFIKVIQDADKDVDGWRLYHKIEYIGNGEIDITVDYRWFYARPDMAVDNAILIYNLWRQTSGFEDPILVILFEGYKYLKIDKSGGKVIISDEDENKMIERIKELESKDRAG